VRNGGHYLLQALESLIAQSDPEWQLVVLDNASTDGTRDNVRRFADPRITLIESDRSLDIYESWHRGLAVAQAHQEANPLLTFIGHDDWLYPDFVARAKQMASQWPEATLYQTPLDLVDENGKVIRPGKPIPQHEDWLDMAVMMAWNFRDSVGTGYFFRARDYVRVGGMPKLPRILYADHLLFLRLARLGYKRADINAGCAYRLHRGSTSGSMSVPKINDQVGAYFRFVDQLIKECPEITRCDIGRAAMQTWIGRELYLFDAPAVRASLDPVNRDRVARLRGLLEEFGGEARADHWSYQSGGRISRMARNAKLHLRFALARRQARNDARTGR
jgi:glycosyltransferase involved in cell wall biosynthesis